MQEFSCFVINLDKDVDRLNFMNTQLSDIGIQYEKLSAIVGRTLTESQLREIYEKEISENIHLIPLNKGEIGCAASHLAIYKKIVANKIPYALVLEDDVKLSDNIKEIIYSQIKIHKNINHFDYLHFDYFAYGFDFLNIWIPGVYSIYLAKRRLLKPYFLLLLLIKFFILLPILTYEEVSKRILKNSALRPVRDMYFAGAYLVTLHGAKKLLSLGDKVIYTADRLPNIVKKKYGLRVKIYTPLVAKQLKSSFPSNLK